MTTLGYRPSLTPLQFGIKWQPLATQRRGGPDYGVIVAGTPAVDRQRSALPEQLKLLPDRVSTINLY